MTTPVQSTDALIRCDYCQGMTPTLEGECVRCGAPLAGDQPEITFGETSLDDFIVAAHQKLAEAGTSAAELAFGVGCTLAVLVAGMLMVIIFIAFTRTWTILAVILFILTLISFLISSSLANRAREATTRKTYQREVEPEIDQFTILHGISHADFIDRAVEILPARSPVLTYSKRDNQSD
ncbi:MAG: hypothetical protein ACWGOY_02300 [Anaerolineales bacterium]